MRSDFVHVGDTMKAGDIVFGENGAQWKLISQHEGDLWIAHFWISEAAHIRGVSPPLHLINVSYMNAVAQEESDGEEG